MTAADQTVSLSERSSRRIRNWHDPFGRHFSAGRTRIALRDLQDTMAPGQLSTSRAVRRAGHSRWRSRQWHPCMLEHPRWFSGAFNVRRGNRVGVRGGPARIGHRSDRNGCGCTPSGRQPSVRPRTLRDPFCVRRRPDSRRGRRLIQNRRVNWETCQIGIPGATAKDKENRRVPFNPEGRLAAILKRRSALDPDAFVFRSESGAYQPNIQTAWETLKLLAYGYEPNGTAEHPPRAPLLLP